jgi:hypothetical protein
VNAPRTPCLRLEALKRRLQLYRFGWIALFRRRLNVLAGLSLNPEVFDQFVESRTADTGFSGGWSNLSGMFAQGAFLQLAFN